MRSLRARLILGTALIALLPLAVTTFVLSWRIEAMVRAQAKGGLESVARALEVQLDLVAQDMNAKLQSLAIDPELRRLYLVPRGGIRPLSEYLSERRQLLGLDALEVADTSGAVIAQESRGERIPDLLLSGEAPIQYERQTVGFIRGRIYVDNEFLKGHRTNSHVELALFGGDGKVMASTLADTSLRFSQQTLTEFADAAITRISLDGESFLAFNWPMNGLNKWNYQPYPKIGAFITTGPSDRAVATLKFTSLALAIVGLSLAVVLGILWSSQVSRPVERLADFSRKVAEGNWDEPLQVHSVKELETLVTALDRMRRDLTAYRERLVTSERHAAWSQMARKVAHEVKNPLTPIAVSVADLKRSYEQNREDFPAILDQAVTTISEEVERLKRMLNEFSEFGRLPPPRFEPIQTNDLFTDLAALYAADVRTGRLALDPGPHTTVLHADPAQMRQALVNLLQNSLDAVNGNGHVVITSRPQDDHVEISVTDNGPGLSPEQRERLFSPGFTTKPGGSGLGLVMVERIVNDHQGSITVQSQSGKGTTFTLRVPRAIEREHAVRPDRG